MSPRLIRMAGFTLLPVILAMSLVAAIAFVLNRDNGMNAAMVSAQGDADRARYAAEAGLQAVNYQIQKTGCIGLYPINLLSPVTNNNFGGASYYAYGNKALSPPDTIYSTGTYNGSSVTLTRSNIYVYQSLPKTYTYQPNPAVGADTYIEIDRTQNYGDSNVMWGYHNFDYPLVKFDLSMFPAGSLPVAATASLYQLSGANGAGNISLHRLRGGWAEGTGSSSPLDGATWTTSDGSTAWPAGGDYHPAAVASNPYVSGANRWENFDATDLATAWMTARYPNHGIIILMSAGTASLKYRSSDDSDTVHRPKISFTYLLPCGAIGPAGSAGGTVTLSPIADSFNDSGAPMANNGGAATLKTYYTPSRENRTVIQFDASSIQAGATVQSATLRMYVGSVGAATSNTKNLWANAVDEPWVEGIGNNTNKACPGTLTAGTSWNYRTNCSNWAFIHPPNSAPGWTAMAPMPTARTNHMVATVNNKIYTLGGYSPVGGYFDTVEEYDPATNTWAVKAPMPTKRSDAAAAVVNGKIYVMGGTSNGANTLKVNEVYDPTTDTWATKAAMGTGRKSMAAAAVNNKIYVIGGATTATEVNTNQEYDPAADKWTTKAAMTTARMYLSTQSVNGKVYAIGGRAGSSSVDNNEVYDPGTNTWVTKAALPSATYFMASAVLGNKIYLVGGMRGMAVTKAVVMYDTLNNAYASQLDYPLAADASVAAAVNGHIFSMGGDDNVSTVYQNNYKFNSGAPLPVATAVDESTSNSPLAANFNKGWITFDLKPLVQEWVDGIRPNNGVVIYTDGADQFNINSRQSIVNKPQLIIAY